MWGMCRISGFEYLSHHECEAKYLMLPEALEGSIRECVNRRLELSAALSVVEMWASSASATMEEGNSHRIDLAHL